MKYAISSQVFFAWNLRKLVVKDEQLSIILR
jgi:hypothetical protein